LFVASDYEAIRYSNIRKYGEETAHLAFLADLYPDRTHFIFELIQNAEDAEATVLSFHLRLDRLEVSHDGRPFTAADVIGICGVVAGTKKDKLNQIGKFGVGFKSVYAYTRSPEVHCRDEHFTIRDYIRPFASPSPDGLRPDETRFVFPFDRPNRPPEVAIKEIAAALQRLELRTILFLRNVQRIEVEGSSVDPATLERTREGLTVTLCEKGNGRLLTEKWSVWSRCVDPTQPDLRVECAFLHSSDSDKPGLRAVERSPLIAFFATAKETHLGFLIQGPYRTTPGRDNVPEGDDWNRRLVAETALLLRDVLGELRDGRRLNAAVLASLPISALYFGAGTMFRPLFEASRIAFQELELLPSGERYVRSVRAKLARSGDLRELLDPEQLGALCAEGAPLYWLASDITVDRFPALWNYLRDDLGIEVLEPEGVVGRMTQMFLEGQTDEWIARLYSFLEGQPALWRQRDKLGNPGVARRKPIIRLEDGSQVLPFDASGRPVVYLPSEIQTPGMKIVRSSIAQDPRAGPFLERLGLTKPDFVAVVMDRILPWYREGTDARERDHMRDMRLIGEALDKAEGVRRTQLAMALCSTPFLEVENAATGVRRLSCPSSAYWPSAELRMYFEGNPDAWFADQAYDPWHRQLSELGVRSVVRVSARSFNSRGHVPIVDVFGWHARGLDRFDPNADVDGLGFAVQNPPLERSLFIWNELLLPNVHLIAGLVEYSKRQEYVDSWQSHLISPLGNSVISGEWIYDRSGGCHVPSADLSLDDLDESYQRDDSLARALGLVTPAVDEASRELGVPATVLRALSRDPSLVAMIEERLAAAGPEPEDLQREESFDSEVAFSEEVEKAFARPTWEAPDDRDDVEEGESGGLVANPELRRERIQEELEQRRRGEPPPETRFRRVTRKEWAPKNAVARNFLLEQYSGRCQICQDGFAKLDGSPYFECLYLVSSTRARWIDRPGCMLCLCPTCCAKFLYGAIIADDILDQISRWRSRREGGSGEPGLTIEMCGSEVNILYTEKHFLDLQEMIRAQPL
jgi:hypothetical protein